MKIDGIVIGYGILSALAIALGLYDFIYCRDSTTEHFLPAALLFFVGLPCSLSLFPLCIIFPVFFSSFVLQYIWINACILFQLVILYRGLRAQNHGPKA